MSTIIVSTVYIGCGWTVELGVYFYGWTVKFIFVIGISQQSVAISFNL